jgi:hypothetical protein
MVAVREARKRFGWLELDDDVVAEHTLFFFSCFSDGNNW